MILFHSDLDNTLIYSHRHDIGPDKICIEMYQNRELSFISKEAMEILRRIQPSLVFVPTTTRTIEQYHRIHFQMEIPKYALVCNGGILLVDGHVDDRWHRQSINLISRARKELEASIELLKRDENRYFEIRYIEKLFIFTKSKEPQKTIKNLRSSLDSNQVDVLCNKEKIYVIPKELRKGNGAIRLKELLHPEKVIAAGDSLFDISMLRASDLGLCPYGLMTDKGKTIREYPKESFTVEILKEVERQIKKTAPDI